MIVHLFPPGVTPLPVIRYGEPLTEHLAACGARSIYVVSDRQFELSADHPWPGPVAVCKACAAAVDP